MRASDFRCRVWRALVRDPLRRDALLRRARDADIGSPSAAPRRRSRQRPQPVRDRRSLPSRDRRRRRAGRLRRRPRPQAVAARARAAHRRGGRRALRPCRPDLARAPRRGRVNPGVKTPGRPVGGGAAADASLAPGTESDLGARQMRPNLAERAGRWSAAHWKTATFGWLAFVAVAVVLGQALGTVKLSDAEQASGEPARAERALANSGLHRHAGEAVLVRSASLHVSDPAFRAELSRVEQTRCAACRRRSTCALPAAASSRADLPGPPRGDRPVRPARLARNGGGPGRAGALAGRRAAALGARLHRRRVRRRERPARTRRARSTATSRAPSACRCRSRS